ncbi:MAG: YkgJ family cysteine cluster protein [Candidatus Thorarchaeota archaeon]
MRFSCQRSGRCCSHPKLFITLTIDDLIPLLKSTLSLEKLINNVSFLKLDDSLSNGDKKQISSQLVIRPIKTKDGEIVPILKKKFNNAECVFYDTQTHSCSIYENRPMACQIFPLGFTEISGKKAVSWNGLGLKICPGINQGEELPIAYLKSLIENANRNIEETNKKIDIINSETEKSEKLLTAKEALWTLLLIASQNYQEQSN